MSDRLAPGEGRLLRLRRRSALGARRPRQRRRDSDLLQRVHAPRHPTQAGRHVRVLEIAAVPVPRLDMGSRRNHRRNPRPVGLSPCDQRIAAPARSSTHRGRTARPASEPSRYRHGRATPMGSGTGQCTLAAGLGGLGRVYDEDTANMAAQTRGFRASHKRGQTLGNYQEVRARHLQHRGRDYVGAFPIG